MAMNERVIIDIYYVYPEGNRSIYGVRRWVAVPREGELIALDLSKELKAEMPGETSALFFIIKVVWQHDHEHDRHQQRVDLFVRLANENERRVRWAP